MKKRTLRHRTLITGILEKVARTMGVEIHIEPRWGYVGQIVLPNGRTRYFRNANFDLNGLGASEIAADKDYAQYYMKLMGYPVIPGRTFYTQKWCRAIGSRLGPVAACRYAKRMGFPVIVKPNSKSQGAGVCAVYTKRELLRAAKAMERNERVFLVQRVMTGHDYRIVVLDGRVISAYERFPLTVTGDGRTTVKGLLVRKQRGFNRIERDTEIDLEDRRIAQGLRRRGMTMRSVPAKGAAIQLLPNANLSTGGDAMDVAATLHPEWKTFAKRLARDMNLRYIGIDVISRDALALPPRDFVVIEVNAAPGVDNYAKIGPRQARIVEDLYRKVLVALTK